MPTLSIPVQQQLSATIFNFGRTTEGAAGQYMADQFQRETVNPTGYPAFYTTSVVGAGTTSISVTGTNGSPYLVLSTSANISDLVNTRLAELIFTRTPYWDGMDTKQQLEANIFFQHQTAATTVKMFVGFHDSLTTNLAALPTTASHFGIQSDSAANANFRFTSGNGGAQVLTDTGIALDTSFRRLQLLWTGLNTVIMNLYSRSAGSTQPYSFNTSVSSITDTALGSIASHKLQFYIETRAAAGRVLTIQSWKIAWS